MTEVQTFPDRDIPFQKPFTQEDEFKLQKARMYRAFFRSSVFYQLSAASQPRDIARYTDRYVPRREDVCVALSALLHHPKRCFPRELLSATPPTRRRGRPAKKTRDDAVLRQLEGKEQAGGADKAEGPPEDEERAKKSRGEGEEEGADEEGEGVAADEEEDAGDYGDAYMDGGLDKGDEGGESGDEGGDEATF